MDEIERGAVVELRQESPNIRRQPLTGAGAEYTIAGAGAVATVDTGNEVQGYERIIDAGTR